MFSVTVLKYWKDVLLSPHGAGAPWAYDEWMDTAQSPKAGWKMNEGDFTQVEIYMR
jgi:hypothetical protein